MTTRDRGSCGVAGCDDPATGSYLHAVHDSALEFALCARHVARMQAGTRPVVVIEDGEDDEPSGTLVME